MGLGSKQRVVPAIDRFWKKVDRSPGHGPNGDCWLWTGCTDDDGYGRFERKPRKRISAHKFSFLEFRGDIPDGLNVCHTCDIRNCVNPDHLWLGDNNANTQDMYRKGRSRHLRGEAIGNSKLREQDVIAIRASNETQEVLAQRYGVVRTLISRVINRKVWTHI